jgi:hypothetical protein
MKPANINLHLYPEEILRNPHFPRVYIESHRNSDEIQGNPRTSITYNHKETQRTLLKQIERHVVFYLCRVTFNFHGIRQV